MAEGNYYVRRTEAGTMLLADEPGRWLGSDEISWGPARYRTRFRALWDDDGIYLRYDVRDPAPWHTMTKRDDPLWDEEVVEIFLDLDGSGTHYAEVELNPANVVCDVRMVRAVPEKEMDLAWQLVGLSTRVYSRDDGWSGHLFLPFDGLGALPSARNISMPPEAGDAWRFNVYRIERPGGKTAPADGAVFAAYSPTGSPSFHVPDAFQRFVFS